MLSDAKLLGMIPTTDFARAKTFYCGTLGLPFLKDDGFALTVQAGQNTIRIVKVQSFQPLPFTLLGWEVAAIEDEVRTLTAAGIVFERFSFLAQGDLGIWTAPGGDQVAWFKDPDGNTLSLSQHVPG